MRLVFLFALACSAVGAIEIACVVYDTCTGSLSQYRAPDLGIGVRSWTVHHAMRPGFTSPNINTNSFGLRSPEVAIPKPSGTYRILFLGDSFTFGLRMREELCFARRVEQRLRSDYGVAAEVVNAGVVSYCPLLEYLQYRHHLHVLEPDLVVLNFDMSDVHDHMDYSRSLVETSDGVPLFVTEDSLERQASRLPGLMCIELVRRGFHGLWRHTQSLIGGFPFARDADRYLWTIDDGPQWTDESERAMAPIAELARLLEHDHIEFILATYPEPWQVAADATPSPAVRERYGIGLNRVHMNDRPFEKLHAFASSHGIRFLNATSAFREHPDPASLYYGNDMHFTAAGHDLYSEVLARFIAETIVPPSPPAAGGEGGHYRARLSSPR